MAASRGEVLRLYRSLLREATKFSAYNFRTYFLRRIKDAFRENKTESDVEKIEKLIVFGKENLEIIKRQVIVGQLYSAPKLVVEIPPTLS